MPIFELDETSLIPIRRQAIDSGVYEAEIEELLWENLEEITGDNLFRVARQARLSFGRIPDVVALDPTGRVVVIEVKRDVDRGQLAQALEYAGWAGTTSLDELAGMYHGGTDSFWDDWREFTGTSTPLLVSKDPRLILVARTFDKRTSQALDFLVRNQLPVQVLKVAFYLDDTGRRFLDVEWETEPETTSTSTAVNESEVIGGQEDFREVTMGQVAALLSPPVTLVWNRPRKGTRHEATLLESNKIRLDDGREFRTPSGAAMAAAGVLSYDGWYAWRVGEDGPTLNELRHKIADGAAIPAAPSATGSMPEPGAALDG